MAAAIVAALRARGSGVRALKPLITGLDDPPDPVWPPDHELLARASGQDPDDVKLRGYGPAVSPHLAAELRRRAGPHGEARAGCARRRGARRGELLVVEGVGGLLVPIAPGYDVRDLAGALGLPVVVVARPGLGTINHTLLTLEAARVRGAPRGRSRAQPVARRARRDRAAPTGRRSSGWGASACLGLPELEAPDPDALAAAGAGLPLEDWLA